MSRERFGYEIGSYRVSKKGIVDEGFDEVIQLELPHATVAGVTDGAGKKKPHAADAHRDLHEALQGVRGTDPEFLRACHAILRQGRAAVTGLCLLPHKKTAGRIFAVGDVRVSLVRNGESTLLNRLHTPIQLLRESLNKEESWDGVGEGVGDLLKILIYLPEGVVCHLSRRLRENDPVELQELQDPGEVALEQAALVSLDALSVEQLSEALRWLKERLGGLTLTKHLLQKVIFPMADSCLTSSPDVFSYKKAISRMLKRIHTCSYLTLASPVERIRKEVGAGIFLVLKDGDHFVIRSDGLHLSEEEMLSALELRIPNIAARRLVHLGRQRFLRNGREPDDSTVMVVAARQR